ncbi:MAG TPA: type II toxin-antitoxin system RelE/ParE family toxin [Devosia sp.]|nr:type II toxin-antitoxin system RelE/ParE family toxin [Devosia sp.]
MEIGSVRHRGLRRLLEREDVSGLPAAYVDKIIKMLSFLQEAKGPGELRSVPIWKVHTLSGDRKGVWSLHVSPNWRLTFAIDPETFEIVDLDLEDYH